jgi:hypothetical protein
MIGCRKSSIDMRCTVSLVHRRKISRDAHVQTSKRARALGTAVYKARPRSSSFLPTTTSFSQLVYQNLLYMFSAVKRNVETEHVCFLFASQNCYSPSRCRVCFLWPPKSESWLRMSRLLSGPPAFVPRYSLSRQISAVKKASEMMHVCFLWPPKFKLSPRMSGLLFRSTAFLKTYVLLSKSSKTGVMCVLSGLQKLISYLPMFCVCFSTDCIYTPNTLFSHQTTTSLHP